MASKKLQSDPDASDHLRVSQRVLNRYTADPIWFLVTFDAKARPVGLAVELMTGVRGADECVISAALLRRLPVQRIVADAKVTLLASYDAERASGSDPEWPFVSLLADELAEPFRKRPGRAGRPDRFYAEVAARYVELIGDGTRDPIAQMAEQHHANRGTVRNWIVEARNRGLIDRPGQGRAAGALTSKARKLLEVAS